LVVILEQFVETTMITRRTLLTTSAVAAATPISSILAADTHKVSVKSTAKDISSLPRQKVELVKPPFIHPHEQVAKGGPKVVQFQMTVQEKEITLDDQGAKLQAMTFEGSIPGPMMVVHEGDYVELTLINPETNSMPHNIDFHSATGALGGGGLTLIHPGEQTVLRWKATRSGVFVYHCAPEGMVPWHVVSGMAGAVMVLPRDGLKDEKGKPLKYDRAYYIGENDFYVPRDADGNYKTYETVGESYEDTVAAMRTLTPTHVVFNGKVGALTGKDALQAKVGEKVLIIHSQANRDSRPHLIGGHGDYVWETGKFAEIGRASCRERVCVQV
jgi:nitrite reductase (NO-forming)